LIYKRNLLAILKNAEFKYYLILLFFSAIIVFIFMLIGRGTATIPDKLFHAFFETTSMLTTSGYSISNYNIWPTAGVMLLFLLMIIGGCSMSSAGGIKVFRFIIILNLIKDNIKKRIHPKINISKKNNSTSFDARALNMAIGFVFAYILIFISSSFLISLFENGSMLTNVSAALSCLSNIGTGFGDVGPGLTFSFLSTPSKIILICLMIIGRLGVVSALAVLMRKVYK
jgi:trk system potassium uptake protein TrkH